jgi:GH35 family endo-1,4-beta-xylanase
VDAQGRKTKGGPRISRLAVGLALLAASLLAASPAAGATLRSEFYGTVQTATLDKQDFQGMQAAGVRVNRFILNWIWVQPKPGKFKWDSADWFIGGLASRGIRAMPSVWGNPNWVAGGSATPPTGGAKAQQQWQKLLKALVRRYGSRGDYWKARYHEQFGANATPLPITSWQIWNEPNVKKYFTPYPSTGQYARLLQISAPAIKSIDRNAQVGLAGMPGYGDVTAWDFLNHLYRVPGIKAFFDAAALHPYAKSLAQYKQEIQKVRKVIKGHNDAATPLWISELAWGSAPPDRFGINKGPAGQAKMLKRAFKMVLSNRTRWNVQHLFWYHWRDPKRSRASCSFCASAALLNFNRTAKPALKAFKSFTRDKIRPKATITAGPAQNAVTRDPTPTFRFRANEAGSTFLCKFDAKKFAACTAPLTLRAALANGAHTFSLRAVDAVGNASVIVSRSFTVKTH